jgi:hypothetical protein
MNFALTHFTSPHLRWEFQTMLNSWPWRGVEHDPPKDGWLTPLWKPQILQRVISTSFAYISKLGLVVTRESLIPVRLHNNNKIKERCCKFTDDMERMNLRGRRMDITFYNDMQLLDKPRLTSLYDKLKDAGMLYLRHCLHEHCYVIQQLSVT